MPLPSQNAGRGSSRTMMSRKRQTPFARQTVLVAMGAAVLIGCVWIASAMFGGDSPRNPESPDLGRPTVATTADHTPPASDPEPIEPIPAPRTAYTTPQWPQPSQPVADTSAPVESPRQAPDNLAIPAPGNAAERIVEEAQRLITQGKPLEARARMNDALRRATADAERAALRRALTELHNDILFSPKIVPGDPITGVYKVERGDSLSKIVRAQGLKVDMTLLAHVNRLSSPDRIRLGQNLKIVRGPFHAIVDKSDFRLDLYWGSEQSPDQWVYIRSFPVGLGEDNSTPLGDFRVKPDSRLVNPHWVNPRTGQRFHADDPLNPIGEHWIGLEGLGEAAAFSGYGIHGTIEPQSIGRNMSMGCIRMLPADVELIYGLLADGVCRVRIVP
ncbi:MAG: L,D-transpeptidase family protein [Phycisphaeraceae bacterium]|nr:L,D-transpeptidase family protein [Phycisphaeraceae bacterium]